MPEKGDASESTRKAVRRDLAKGRKGARKRTSAKRSRASKRRLQREGHSAASKRALSAHARKAAKKRTRAERSASARKGVHKRIARRAQRVGEEGGAHTGPEAGGAQALTRRAAIAYAISAPPSTTNVWPVQYEDALEARNTAAPAMSAGCP